MPVTPDSTLNRMGRELTVTLSATLGRVADAGVVDPQAILASTRDGAAPLSRREAMDLALRLGAGRVLHGSLVRVGRGSDSVRVGRGSDSVRAEADLIDLASRRPIAHAAAAAATGDLPALTDSVTLALVQGLWGEGDLPAPSLGGSPPPPWRRFGTISMGSAHWPGASSLRRSPGSSGRSR